uniref:Ig-like domain-containing protein n=1 Tax=Ciona savignyi TaxID=51511 RepID=H2ZIF5_CIOSA
MIDVEGRPTSLFATAPMHWKSWFFEPVVPEMTSKATSRQLHCVLPLSNDVTPITWYKDEAPVAGNPLFEVQVVRTTSQIRSTIILKPSEDGSKGQSGVYSCVVKSGSKHWVLMNHVVAVLNPEIITPGGMASILNFIKDTTGSSDSLAVYIALGSISGVCFLLISAVSARNYCKKRIQQKRRLEEGSKKSGRSTDRTPLVKTKSRSKKRHNPRPSTGGRGTESDGSDWLLQAEIDRDVDDIDLYEDMIYS